MTLSVPKHVETYPVETLDVTTLAHLKEMAVKWLDEVEGIKRACARTSKGEFNLREYTSAFAEDETQYRLALGKIEIELATRKHLDVIKQLPKHDVAGRYTPQ